MGTSSPPPRQPLEPRECAIIVGASSGLGAALARELAHQGYHVALVARREALLKELCENINSASVNSLALYYTHDVVNRHEVPELFRKITNELGGLDLLIYNAGLQYRPRLDEFHTEKDVQTLQVNFLGAIAWINEAAARFARTGSGHIVGISSISGDRGRSLDPVYNASKAGLNSFLEGLRNRLSRLGVHVTTVIPGFMKTALLENAPRSFWVITPEQAAHQIYGVIRKKKQVAYVPAKWRLVGLAIIHIPSFVFRRLNI